MISIDKEKCIGCGLCSKDCQCGDIKIVDGKAQVLNRMCLNCGHCISICPKNAVSIDIYDMDEVKSYDEESFSVNSENLLNFIKFRRSIRHFKSTSVEKEKIEKILEAGRFTPTGGNRQPVSYIVVQENMEKLTAMSIEALYDVASKAQSGENSFLSGSNSRYINSFKLMHDHYKSGKDLLFYKAPALIIVIGNKDISPNPVVDAALAASNMELMANALNLGACFNGFFVYACENPKIREFLGLSGNHQVVTSIALGYPNITHLKTVPRKGIDVNWM